MQCSPPHSDSVSPNPCVIRSTGVSFRMRSSSGWPDSILRNLPGRVLISLKLMMFPFLDFPDDDKWDQNKQCNNSADCLRNIIDGFHCCKGFPVSEDSSTFAT